MNINPTRTTAGGDRVAGHVFIRPGQVAPDRPARDARMECGRPEAEHLLREALAAVLDAIDIPYPATVGEGEIRDRILKERVMHAAIFLQSVLSEDQPGYLRESSLAYFREKLAEHPAEGYRIWGQAVAELHAGQDGAK